MVAVAAGDAYRIDIWVGGKVRRSIRRTVEPAPVTEGDVRRMYPEGRRISFGGGGGCTITVEEMIEKLGVASTMPVLSGVLLGPDGTLFVQRFTFPDEQEQVDVFAPEGRYLGSLIEHGLPVGFPAAGWMAIPIEDAESGGYSLGLFVVRDR